MSEAAASPGPDSPFERIHNRDPQGRDYWKSRDLARMPGTKPHRHAARILRQSTPENGATFPVAPRRSGLPAGYATTLGEIKRRIQAERLRTVLSANATMVLLYWDIGRMILERQDRAGWGAKVIDRLAADLREAFPNMKGFSPRNLKYMRAFAAAWPKAAIVQEALAQIPWYHHIALIEKLDGPAERLWYARQARTHGWSHNVLAMQIGDRAHERHGKALTNFKATMPPEDSDMAEQVFKDPYLFDFLGTADVRREREVEQALVDHIQHFLLELGSGFAFVGRQVRLEFSSRDSYLDLLFYHLKLRCYVVVELKAVPFDPAFVGQMNVYLSAVDDRLRHAGDKPTIGLLLCRSKDRIVVEYALRDLRKPIGVAHWETVEKLPENLKGSLPTVEELEAELSRENARGKANANRTHYEVGKKVRKTIEELGGRASRAGVLDTFTRCTATPPQVASGRPAGSARA